MDITNLGHNGNLEYDYINTGPSYLITAKRFTPALWTQTVQNKVNNVKRHRDCVAFVDPLQPHTGSREFPFYKCVFLRKWTIFHLQEKIVLVGIWFMATFI